MVKRMASNASVSPLGKTRRTQQERRDETRLKLVRAAIEVLANRGGANFTTAAVAAKAGLTRGAIQYHFDTPKDLLRAAVAQIADDMSQVLDADALLKLPLDERIDCIVEAYWNGFRSANYVAFLEIAIQGRHDPDLSEAITDALHERGEERSTTWLAVFSDTNVSPEDVLAWRESLLITLRGLAVTQMIHGSKAAAKQQVNEFKAIFKQQLISA
jgi:AcrR family transcriptional regulator